MGRIIVGHFGQSYGIQGWIKVRSLTRPAENIFHYHPWQIQHEGLWRSLSVIETKRLGKVLIAKLEECNTPELAKTYTNDPIAIEQSQLPPLPPSEYYWIDLIGLKVINQEGVDLGVITSLFETGSNDVLVVQGDRKRLLPYTNDVVREVALKEKIMRVDWDADF